MGIIVLAGGHGEEFQTGKKWVDKLLIKVNGVPLLLQTVKNLECIDEEVVAATKPDRLRTYSGLLKGRAKVDEELSSLISINTPADLMKKQLKISGPAESRELKGHSHMFWNTLESCSKGELSAATFFKMEANVYESMGLSLLKRYAIKGAEICEKKV